MNGKSVIQKIVDLLEENGYHVFKAEEEIDERDGICGTAPSGVIQLRIAPYREM